MHARRQASRVANIASVASFFLSRIDTAVDKQLDALVAGGDTAARALRGKAAIASACRAYEIYEELLAGSQWQALAGLGARPQRLLWASTSAKDPTFSPVKYVEELVVPDTVNTMPLETLNTYRRLGRPALRLERHIAESADQREAFERIGLDLEAVAQQLEREGVSKFIEPFDKLQEWLQNKRKAPLARLSSRTPALRGHSGYGCDTHAAAAPGRRTARACAQGGPGSAPRGRSVVRRLCRAGDAA